MNKMRYITTSIFCFCVMSLFAFKNPESAKPSKAAVTYRINCAQATAQTDMDINNVRARLLVGGDVWWDGNSGQYVVPKVAPGETEVSSIFAGAVWIGGVDPAGNLKVAAQQFGTSSGSSDFWPGPLTEGGVVEQQTCADWDRFFSVTGAEIDLHLAQFQQARLDSVVYDVNLIPQGVREWPGLGNEFFFDAFEFELPDAPQGLGAFWDEDGDGFYNPQNGDYPIIEVRGCPDPQYPDQMKFWIYNDNGNVHTESGADPILMEIQVQAFAYETNDELNNMTFQRYKLINRAIESIDSTYFALWVDADLGCSEDDYIGCDTTRSLMYVYNTDAVDGSAGANCTGGVATYGENIPYLGVDYFRGPLAPKAFGPNGTLINPGIGQTFDTIVEIGMTSFIYFNRQSPTTNPAQVDPSTAQEYYNYLTGSWLNGEPITQGGSGIGGTVPTSFVFPDEPNVAGGWSMCEEELPLEDRRTIQASGPFRLDPGQVNELIIGVPWVPNVSYPCPDMGRLQRADDIAQGLFNSCFDILDGPDAPDVNWVELDERLIAVLTNDDISSNNRFEAYSELDPLAPTGQDGANYEFEGYIMYQLADAGVSIDELDDPEKARIVFQSDVQNEAVDIFNWLEVEDPNGVALGNPATLFVPELQIESENQGVRSSFELDLDAFTGAPLINHTNYYYTAIAYAYNEFDPFNPVTLDGQPTAYLEGRRNIETYTVTPRPIVDRDLMAQYGDGAVITRLDGKGAGGNFLSISTEERDRLLAAQDGQIPAAYEGVVVYEEGGGPVQVSVIDPLRVQDGVYTLRLDQDAALATGNSSWELFDENNQSLGRGRQNLQNQNEQIFGDLGFSVTIQQTDDAGDLADDTNGAIGQGISYEDPNQSWLTAVPDNSNTLPGAQFYDLHYQATAGGEINADLDPEQAFTGLGTGHFAPYTLMDWSLRPTFYATPAWLFPQSNVVQAQNPLEELNNVDVVFTSDKSKWSRCVVVETGNRYFSDIGFDLDDGKTNFEPVDRPSVSREDNDGDGRPDPDGTGEGFAWFPGYAIDVETGVRLNIFFGENSAFGDNTLLPENLLDVANGSDMMFNPSAQAAVPPNIAGGFNPTNIVLGGMHYMYVTRQPYDECEFINNQLRESLTFRRVDAVSLITWAGIGLGSLNVPMLSYADGLIPTETVVELRADNPYCESDATDDNNAFPSYEFELEGASAAFVTTEAEINEQLDMINVVPNPYHAFSRYESDQFDNVVKITNLPAQCVVTIYSLDGQFIRQYNRDEVEQRNSGANPGVVSSQINPVIEWDLNNAAGIPIASGVYLIHIAADGLGERVIKWFGVNRQFDPTGL